MNVVREAFEGVLTKHAEGAAEPGCAWTFSFQEMDPVSSTDSMFQQVIGSLGGLEGYKEVIHPEVLIVTPTEGGGGGSSLNVLGVDMMSRYCMNESLATAAATWKDRLVVDAADLTDLLNLGGSTSIRSDVIKTSEGKPHDSELWLTTPKHYRIERTFEYIGESCLHRVKMVRESSDSFDSMKASDVSRADVKYQYELVWTNLTSKHEHILSHVIRMMQIIQDTIIPITKVKAAEVRKEYLDLVSGHVDRRTPDAQFLAPKPVTLEQRQLVSGDEFPTEAYGNITILKGYCVTDKADGERMLLFVNKKGEAFFINSDLEIRPSSFNFIGAGTSTRAISGPILMDGEYVSARHRIDNVQKDLFAAFDIYFVKDEAVYKYPLVSTTTSSGKTRYDILKDVCSKCGEAMYHELVAKTHSFAEGDNMRDACKALLSKKTLPYDIDGLVFTPADLSVCGYYPGNAVKFPVSMRWDMVFKWKPPQQNTIDFLVSETIPKVRDQATNVIYRRFELMTGYDASQWEPITVSEGLKLRYDPKHGSGRDTRYVKRVFKPLTNGDAGVGVAMVPEACVCVDGSVFATDTIVEFGFDVEAWRSGTHISKCWIPLRVRTDKTRTYRNTKTISKTANDFKVAMSIWRSIHKPVTIEMLTSPLKADDVVTLPGSLAERLLSVDDVYYSRRIPHQHRLSVNMLNFHNHGVKKVLYHKYAEKKDTLLELACGMAGDLPRWQDEGFRFVLGIDLVADNICKAGDGSYARLLNTIHTYRQRGISKPMQNIVFAIGDCAMPLRNGACTEDPDSKALLRVIFKRQNAARLDPMYKHINGAAENNFSTVSCQFAIHYFFQSEEKLNGFLDNVADNLRSGGVFIATFMDGQQVHDLLVANKGKVEGIKRKVPVWAIISRYGSTYGETAPSLTTPPPAESSAMGAARAQVQANVFGKHVDVYIETTGKLIPEFLVHTPTLITKMKDRNISLVDTQLFSHNFNEVPKTAQLYSDIEALRNDPVQTQFSFLNRWIVFRKN